MPKKVKPLARGSYVPGSMYRSPQRPDHRGVDFEAPLGTPIYAPVDMLIIEGADRKPGTVDGFGNWIWGDAQDEHKVDLIFGHMRHADIYVRGGQHVKAGQLIARVGSEGTSTGPHLHFEVWTPPGRIGGKDRDPLAWLAGATDPVAPAASSPAPTKKDPIVPAYTMNEIDLTGTHASHSSRHGARPWLFVLHTQEGGGNAEGLHNYFKRAQVSYHYTVDNATLIGSVNTDRAAWSVLDANPYTLNLCFAGSRAAMSREEWIGKFGNAIDLAAQVAVRDCIQYGIDLNVHGRDYDKIRRRIEGICDHSGITYGLSIGDHTDVGANFPWDVFADRVRYWVHGSGAATPAPVPTVSAIDAEAKSAVEWIGARITDGEGDAIDGGKYAHFENGSIYWHPTTGAFAIPKAIFEKYEQLRWEQSYLGFPIGRHTVLTNPTTGEPWGDVQGFQGGAIYRRYGQSGYAVTGMIRAYWNRAGFENGRFGRPISDEIWADDTGTVRYQNFEHGRITWSADGSVGTHERPGFDAISTEEN